QTVATEGKGIAELLEACSAGNLVAGGRPKKLAGDKIASAAIDHLGVAVKSLEQAAAFYESIGLAVGHRETVAAEKVHVAMLPAGDSRIELLEPADANSSIAKLLDKRGPALQHVALPVPDLNAVVEKFSDGRIRV